MGFPVDPLGVALVFGVGGYLAATTTAFIVRALAAPKEPWRNSLDGAQSEPVPVAAVMRLVKWPLLGVGLVVVACANQTAVVAAVPALFASYGTSVASAMPLFASTKQQAFVIGRAYEALRRAAAGASTATSDEIKPEAASILTDDVVAPILAVVSDVVGRNVSVADLLDAPRGMALQDAQRSAGDRVLGALSLVNIAWIVSILLIAGLAIPCLYALATPFRERLLQLWRRVIWPAIVALEPAYEPLAYIGVAGVAVESLRYPCGRHDVAGSMVAFTAVALFAAAMGYTTYRHARRNAPTAINRMAAPPSSQQNVLERVWRGVVALSIAAVAAPLAVARGSTLLGYLAVSATLVACGFTAVGYPLCLFIGFREKKEAYRVAGMCLLMTLSNAALRALGVSNALTAPFESALSVVGTAVYFLALSIISVLDGGFGVLVYAGNLVGYVVLGSMLAMPGMVNAALAWGSVEAFILTGYRVRNKGVNVLVVFAFTAACSLYAASLYVSTHPEVLAAMLTGR